MKRKAIALLKTTGATLDENMVRHENYTLDAPEGMVFNANGEPSYFVANYNRENVRFGGPSMADVWSDIIEVLEEGLSEEVAN
jgi:hypothetical protein